MGTFLVLGMFQLIYNKIRKEKVNDFEEVSGYLGESL
jgi:hypothetical protein